MVEDTLLLISFFLLCTYTTNYCLRYLHARLCLHAFQLSLCSCYDMLIFFHQGVLAVLWKGPSPCQRLLYFESWKCMWWSYCHLNHIGAQIKVFLQSSHRYTYAVVIWLYRNKMPPKVHSKYVKKPGQCSFGCSPHTGTSLSVHNFHTSNY